MLISGEPLECIKGQLLHTIEYVYMRREWTYAARVQIYIRNIPMKLGYPRKFLNLIRSFHDEMTGDCALSW